MLNIRLAGVFRVLLKINADSPCLQPGLRLSFYQFMHGTWLCIGIEILYIAANSMNAIFHDQSLDDL